MQKRTSANILANWLKKQAVNARSRRWLEKNIKGFSDVKVGKIKEAIKKMRVCRFQIDERDITDESKPNADFMTGSELAEVRKRCFRISTGSKQLDHILNG